MWLGSGCYVSDAGVVVGWVCVPHQSDSNACIGTHGYWKILSSHLCCLFYSELRGACSVSYPTLFGEVV